MGDAEIYQKLAEFMERLPGGFPPSETGAHLRLLERLFTSDEAALAVNLTLGLEEAKTVAARANLSIVETEKRLEEMTQKGLIVSVKGKDGIIRYEAAPFVVGIWEFQVNRLSPELVKNREEYRRTQQPRPLPIITGQIRTVAIGKSIPVHFQVLPYEKAEELIKAEDKFAVAPCICRRAAKMRGYQCKAPEETCFWFGDFADFYTRTGLGRRIELSEVEQILRTADQYNLVLQPSNSQKAEFICCCCGDCCGVLRSAKNHPRPAEVVSSGFIANYDTDNCQGCQVCTTRCQMQAIKADKDRITLDSNRCIGCGLCVSTCPGEALTLKRRPGAENISIPPTMDDARRLLSKL